MADLAVDSDILTGQNTSEDDRPIKVKMVRQGGRLEMQVYRDSVDPKSTDLKFSRVEETETAYAARRNLRVSPLILSALQ